MLRIIFLLIFAAIAYFLNDYTLEKKALVLVISVLIFLFVDLYIIKNAIYHSVLTTIITAALLFVSLFAVCSILGIKVSFKMDTSLINTIILNASLLIIFFSLREGATAIYFKKKEVDSTANNKNLVVVDTSAIIDGRIMELCEAGFISNKLVIPEFVVRELQLISDSSNHEKRKKGRRGLDLLKKMKSSDHMSMTIMPVDYDFIKGVDNKLLHFAKDQNARLVTTDFNLIKVAEVEGVISLNINKVATILKPAYAVNEKIKITIVKKGNSKKQGVGYLEDDTMVVVDDAEKFIGQTKTVQVSSFVQSQSGKMLFCKLI